jgi:hypothetical protein
VRLSLYTTVLFRGPNSGPPTYLNFLKIAPRKATIFEILVLLYKKGPPDLQELATSRFQICMREAVVSFVIQQNQNLIGRTIILILLLRILSQYSNTNALTVYTYTVYICIYTVYILYSIRRTYTKRAVFRDALTVLFGVRIPLQC